MLYVGAIQIMSLKPVRVRVLALRVLPAQLPNASAQSGKRRKVHPAFTRLRSIRQAITDATT